MSCCVVHCKTPATVWVYVCSRLYRLRVPVCRSHFTEWAARHLPHPRERCVPQTIPGLEDLALARIPSGRKRGTYREDQEAA